MLHWAGRRAKQRVAAGAAESQGSTMSDATSTLQGHPSAREHPPLQEVRHVDVEMMYNFMRNKYKANVYLSGVRVNEIFDFSLQELKERIKLRITELNVTSSVPLAKAVL